MEAQLVISEITQIGRVIGCLEGRICLHWPLFEERIRFQLVFLLIYGVFEKFTEIGKQN
jgi:hypothetical protein